MTMKRDDCLKVLAKYLPADEIVVSVFTTAFEWIKIRPSPLNYIFTGVMGLGSSHGLGLALGRPSRRIIVLDGDGSLLMNLGTLVTIGNAAPKNLVHFVIENGTYEANGSHPIPGAGKVDFQGLARSSGYASCHAFDDLDVFDRSIAAVLEEEGPVFIVLKVSPGEAVKFDYPMMHGKKIRDEFYQAIKPT